MNRIVALATLALTLGASPQSGDAEPGLYERSLASAVTHAQAELEASITLWEDHSTWENPWRATTNHYEVSTTESRFAAKAIADGLEGMLDHFQRLLGTSYAPSRPVPIYIFPDVNAYNTFGEQYGTEHSSFYASFYADQHDERPIAVIHSGNPTLLRMWVTHGAVHQFVDRTSTGTPAVWIEEGLASYFSTFWAYSWSVGKLQGVIEDGSYIPLQQLLDAGIDQYGADAEVRLTELGMLFNYLLHLREDTRTVEEDGVVVSAPFAEYLRTTLAGNDTSRLPVHELLTERLDQLEADFLAFDAWE
ncbi:MAG: hypothetical protein ACYTG2_01120 [Planctomycetota bacterium]|jgi:hypothetical protein